MVSEANKTLKLALPIILGELAQMTLHIIDTAMVGMVSYKQLAAAALVISVMNIPFVIGIGMTISVSQMVSMAHGRRDGQLVSHYFFNGLFICAITAIIIAGSLFLGKDILFHLNQDTEVATLAAPFLQLMALSIIPMLLFMTLKQFADGLEYTRTAMTISLVGLPINVLLNWLLIFGNLGFPRLELMGAGWATLITRTLMFVALGIVIFRHVTFRRYVAVRKRQWYLRAHTIKDLLHIGIPSSLQVGIETSAFAISAILIGTVSPMAQAAHQIAISCAAFTFMVSMGLAQAGSIRVSNAFGRGDMPKIALIGKSTIVTSVIYGLFCALAFVSLKSVLPLGFTKDVEVLHLASTLLLFAAVFQISDSTQAISAGLLRGIKDVKVPTILIAIAYWVVGIPTGYLFGIYWQMGASGVWLGFIIGLTVASVFLVSRFVSLTRKRS
jgi:MATE family multidrug resistance protein